MPKEYWYPDFDREDEDEVEVEFEFTADDVEDEEYEIEEADRIGRLGSYLSLMKPGWRTTEFWISVALLFSGTVTVFVSLSLGSSPGVVMGAILQVVSLVSYSLSRSLIKVQITKIPREEES